jgi:hypothetical protein
MPTVKDFASKDLTPSGESPPLAPALEKNFFEMDGNVHFRFGFSLASPVRKIRHWIAKALAQ